MSNKRKLVVGFLVMAALIAGALFAYNELAPRFKSQKENSNSGASESENLAKAPDFTVYDIDGHKVKLSDYKGKPVVLNFWASWCPPCKEEMPYFNKAYLEFNEEVVFLMVDLVDGSKETVGKGKEYIKENNYKFPVMFDSTQDAAFVYGIRSIPTTYFIDKDGNIVSNVEGSMEEGALLESIEKIK